MQMAQSYEGKPCQKCSSTTRYKSNNKCVACTTAYNHSSDFKKAQQKYRRTSSRKAYMQQYHKLYGPTYNLKRHNMSQERWNQLYSLQKGKCAICSEPIANEKLCVDHDHKCCYSDYRSCGKCIRGLLCAKHNRGLGYFADKIQDLQNAIKYLSDYDKCVRTNQASLSMASTRPASMLTVP